MRGHLSRDTTTAVAEATKARWLGGASGRGGTLVGLRADLHCLTFYVDPCVRIAVKHVLGEQALVAMVDSFDMSSVRAAIKTHCGGKELGRVCEK